MMDKVHKRLIIVLGMHRGGTSVIARGLMALGVDLGNNLLPPAEENPKGFWEDIDIYLLNEEMLKFLHHDWHSLSPIQPEEIEILRRNGFYPRAAALLQKKTEGIPIFGFKDPRAAKLLSFWKQVFVQLEFFPHYILVIRNPLSVCQSLAKRDGFDLEKSYLMWLEHTINSFTGTNGEHRMVIDYDRLMKMPEAELVRVSKVFQLPVDNMELEKFKLEFLDNDLRHTVYQLEDLAADTAAPPLVREVYSTALDIAADRLQIEDTACREGIRKWGDELYRLKTVLMFADRLEARISERDHLAQNIKAQMVEKERITQALFSQVAEKKHSIQSLASQLAMNEHSVQSLTTQLEKKDQELLGIQSSNAWKTALLFRQIGRIVAPQNSFRNKVLRRLINIFHSPTKIFQDNNIQSNLSLINSSGYFNAAWYLENNPDVAAAKIDPMLHYLVFGGFERRDPSTRFSSGWYLDTYEDVRISGFNPLIHFLNFGKLEGRKPQSTAPMQPPAPEVTRYTQEERVRPQYSSSTIADPSSTGNRIKRWLTNLRAFISIPFGLLSNSKRSKAYYILKNYGIKSLFNVMTNKLKTTLPFIENHNIQSAIRHNPASFENTGSLNIRQSIDKINKIKLGMFLNSETEIVFPVNKQPLVSIILLFYNRAEISLQCLETLLAGAGNIPFEAIIVDNASIDETSALLDRIQNVKIIRNSTNLGFGGGCNQAVDLAVGKYLLFLNNDIELLANSIKVMVDTIENGENIGAVGGKLLYPDGRLQEAGSIIWRDGSCAGYGRNGDPFKPEFSYVRDVDFCSGAFLLTPRDLFLSLGKFDPRYAPAYYEDADYCLQLWGKGYRVVFQPFAVAIHYEFGSSDRANAIALQSRNQMEFTKKWNEVLADYNNPKPKNVIFSREHKSDSIRILFIDDQIPDYRLGSGYPRSFLILNMLSDIGYKVTFLPIQIPDNNPEISQALQLKGIEVIYGIPGQIIDFEAFLRTRPDYYHLAFISRPHNMHDAQNGLSNCGNFTMVVYDAEAIFSLRDILFSQINNQRVTEAEKEILVQTEVSSILDANIITAISEKEKDIFEKYGASSVHVLGHIVKPQPTPATFEERKDILFVGGILGFPSPNEDAVRYFATKVFPLVRQKVKCEFYVVGTNRVKAIWDLESEYIHVIGRINDLFSFYNRCRVFVVPTRYSAGISLKLLEASAFGLPSVTTPLIAEQLGWQENRDILVGHDHTDFAEKVITLYSSQDLFYSLRQNALDRIREEYNSEHFRKCLENILGLAMEMRKDRMPE